MLEKILLKKEFFITLFNYIFTLSIVFIIFFCFKFLFNLSDWILLLISTLTFVACQDIYNRYVFKFLIKKVVDFISQTQDNNKKINTDIIYTSYISEELIEELQKLKSNFDKSNKHHLQVEKEIELLNKINNKIKKDKSELASTYEKEINMLQIKIDNIEKNSGSNQKITDLLDNTISALSEWALNSSGVVEEIFQTDKELSIDRTGVDKIGKHIVDLKILLNKNFEYFGKLENFLSNLSILAEQIELVSLNAAIESARMGEAGRGFVVISEDIKRLSDRFLKEIDSLNSNIKDKNTLLKKFDTNVENDVDDFKSELSKVLESSKKNYEVLRKISENINLVEEKIVELLKLKKEFKKIDIV